MTTTTLARWGNGQGVRIAKATAERAGIRIGDTLDVTVHGDRITLGPVRPRTIAIPDYAAMFAGWDGPRPVEDGFANPAGRERM